MGVATAAKSFGGEEIEIWGFFIREEVPLPSYLVLDELTMMQTRRPRPLWPVGSSGSSCYHLFWCRKNGEETRQEEPRGDGGEKGGAFIFGGM